MSRAIIAIDRRGLGGKATATVYTGFDDEDEATVFGAMVGGNLMRGASEDFRTGPVVVAEHLDYREVLAERGDTEQFAERVQQTRDDRAEQERRTAEHRAELAAERAARERELQLQQLEKDLTLKAQRDEAARLRAAAEKELAKQES